MLKKITLKGEQKKVLFLPPTNPIQIKGVAGSGKTTVALYRAKHLLETQTNLFKEKINRAIGNEWFRTKKQNSINNKSVYKDSKYAIAVALTSYPEDIWTKEDIDTATKKGIERIVNFIFDKLTTEK